MFFVLPNRFEGQPADDDSAAADIIDAAAGGGLRLVVLNTCHGRPLAMAIQRRCEGSTSAVEVVFWTAKVWPPPREPDAQGEPEVSTRLCQDMPALLRSIP